MFLTLWDRGGELCAKIYCVKVHLQIGFFCFKELSIHKPQQTQRNTTPTPISISSNAKKASETPEICFFRLLQTSIVLLQSEELTKLNIPKCIIKNTENL